MVLRSLTAKKACRGKNENWERGVPFFNKMNETQVIVQKIELC